MSTSHLPADAVRDAAQVAAAVAAARNPEPSPLSAEEIRRIVLELLG